MNAEDTDFWQRKWETGEIGFHEPQVNPALAAHYADWRPTRGGRIFVPLCGKSLDLAWLHAQGHVVSGVELSSLAIEAFFAEQGLTPQSEVSGKLLRYRAEGYELFVGDLFDLTSEQLGPVAGLYDRAALVALPAEMRPDYAARLQQLAPQAPQLLVTYDYAAERMQGPPFAISPAEVESLYGRAYRMRKLAEHDVQKGGLGSIAAIERVWLLTPAP